MQNLPEVEDTQWAVYQSPERFLIFLLDYLHIILQISTHGFKFQAQTNGRSYETDSV